MSSAVASKLQGRSLIAGRMATDDGPIFHGFNPVDGNPLEPPYVSASLAEADRAVVLAAAASKSFGRTSGAERGLLLRAIADGLDACASELVERAHIETALPRPRLFGEVARTSGQLRLFADVLDEGSWLMARVDTADPARTPPKPDVRSMLRPLGPVVVFGASNFPLAFSVAGGDTASALAAGNPVIFKAHPAHPGTSELVGLIVNDAVKRGGLSPGCFSLLFDAGYAVGAALVQHPEVRAVGFTGSYRGGRALMDIAAKRKSPIPVYAEMGSTNPVFILPGALAERGEALASGLQGSFTLGGGQFCTKPGLVFAEVEHMGAFAKALRAAVKAGPAFSLLTRGIASNFGRTIGERESLRTAHGAVTQEGHAARASLLETTDEVFFTDTRLSEEVFGPATLLVRCAGKEATIRAAQELKGHLTATVFGTEEDVAAYEDLLHILETKVGRVIFNTFPTGVEVCHAMVHGGPYPATSDGRSTSVGSQAIFRFARPVAYQGLPQAALPEALRDANPLGIPRLWNGEWQGEKL